MTYRHDLVDVSWTLTKNWLLRAAVIRALLKAIHCAWYLTRISANNLGSLLVEKQLFWHLPKWWCRSACYITMAKQCPPNSWPITVHNNHRSLGKSKQNLAETNLPKPIKLKDNSAQGRARLFFTNPVSQRHLAVPERCSVLGPLAMELLLMTFDIFRL